MGNGRLGGSVPEKPERGEDAFVCTDVCVVVACLCLRVFQNSTFFTTWIIMNAICTPIN